MQSMLMGFRNELGISVPADQLEESIVRNRDFLARAASVVITDIQIQDKQLNASATARISVRRLVFGYQDFPDRNSVAQQAVHPVSG